MKNNMGSADKMIRILIAAAIVFLYNAQLISGTLAVILLILASVFILTSFIGFCPLYLPLGWNTRNKGKDDDKDKEECTYHG
jgi:hypothetical protein